MMVKSLSSVKRLLVAALFLTATWASFVTADAAAHVYYVKLAGKPTISAGKHTVQVHIVDATDGKLILDAVIVESKVYMGLRSKPTMTAPVTALPAKNGIFSFKVAPAMAGTWKLHLAGKVPCKPETVAGTIIVDLVS